MNPQAPVLRKRNLSKPEPEQLSSHVTLAQVKYLIKHDLAKFKNDEKLEGLAKMELAIDPIKNLQGVREKLVSSGKDGGVDRGDDGGLGKFGEILKAMQQIEEAEAKAVNYFEKGESGSTKEKNKALKGRRKALTEQEKALKLMEKKAESWLETDKKRLQKDPKRENDPVAVRKRQFAQAIILQKVAREKLKALEEAGPNEYEEARRQAETATRNVEAAYLTISNPPKRIGGDDFDNEDSEPKGNSDSYFIKNGKIVKYIFKPQSGEAVALDWPPGGGAPREVLMSEFNEQMKAKGFDFGVAKTSETKLTSHDFTKGKNGHETSRVGVIQDAFQNATDAEDKFKELMKEKDKEKRGQAIKTFKQSIKTEDVHNVAIMDFMTLNLDRNPGNAMFLPDKDDPKVTRLVPIDSGNLLPPEEVFDAPTGKGNVSDAMDAALAGDEEPIEGNNVLMQLPQAGVPFDEDTIQKISNLDPAEIRKMMQDADGKREGPMKGKIAESTFQMVEDSVAFLQLAVKNNPIPTVNEIGKMYAINEGFKAFKAERQKIIRETEQNQQPDFRPLAQLVAQAVTKAQKMTQDDKDMKEFEKLGGVSWLPKYGWTVNELPTIQEKLNVLQKKVDNLDMVEHVKKLIESNSLTKEDLPNDYDSMPVGEKKQAVDAAIDDRKEKQAIEEAGGDEGLKNIIEQITERKDTLEPNKPLNEWSQTEKANFIGLWNKLTNEGGFTDYDKAVEEGLEKQTSLKRQLDTWIGFKKDQGDLQAAKEAGGEKAYHACREAVSKLGIKDSRFKNDYTLVRPSEKKFVTVTWQEIKDMPAFKNYQSLVEQKKLEPVKNFLDLVNAVKNYKGG
jgi:hypothetical protein